MVGGGAQITKASILEPREHCFFNTVTFKERILRKPTDMKLLSATLRPDRMKRINRADVLTEPPPAPASLSPTAAAAFERLGTLAVAAKTLTALDVELLALAASTLASCQSLETQLSAEGL